MRKSGNNNKGANKGKWRTGRERAIAKADDILLITKTKKIMEYLLNEIVEQGTIMRLELNKKK